MKWDELSDNWCPVARTLAIVGDRWTLLIVRDCFFGRSKFGEFQESLGITKHLLSERLKRLVDAGILDKRAYQTRPMRHEYVLTPRGQDLAPALIALKDWGKTHLPVRRQAG